MLQAFHHMNLPLHKLENILNCIYLKYILSFQHNRSLFILLSNILDFLWDSFSHWKALIYHNIYAPQKLLMLLILLLMCLLQILNYYKIPICFLHYLSKIILEVQLDYQFFLIDFWNICCLIYIFIEMLQICH
jgi:hypothetical protein